MPRHGLRPPRPCKTRAAEAHNVVIDIADPLTIAGPDHAILTAVDTFLRQHLVNTISGVAKHDLSAGPARPARRRRPLYGL